MCELTAQVTSSLLQFPEVTIEALGDESAQDVGLYGKIATGRNGLSWLACGAHLELLNSITGERLSAYRFSGIGEHLPTILAVKEFCWLKRTGLLIGLKEAEGSILCLYDLSVSRVVKAVFLPGKVKAIEPIVNHGGATTSTQRLNQSLRWFFGIAAVVTDTGHVLLIDLCLDDFSCNQSEQEPADLEVVNGSPTEIPRMRESVMREGRHLCFQLQSPLGIAATAMKYVLRTNQLAVGFANGYVQLWNLKTLKKEYCSQLEGGTVPVYAFTFQEPENDPRNCCYLWVVQSAQDGEGDVVSLHLLQLAFGDRKSLTSGQTLYEGLEYCEERYTHDLACEVVSSRTRNTHARLLGCQTIEKFRNHVDREESMTEATSPDSSVSVFSWQVESYGQRKPSTYLGIFDINRWYHAQMPDSLRVSENLGSCPYFALWSLDAVVDMTFPYYLLDVLVHERSLSRGVPPSYPPPEQFFNPSTYSFDATCLLNTGLVHMTGSGFQKETLNYLKKAGPFLSEAVPDGYSRCLMAGLLSPRLADIQPSCLSQEKREAILSAGIESSSLGLITTCIKQWTTEEQPRSAASLRFVLEWTWKKITRTKEELDVVCVPLFDGSSHFIDPHTLQSLQHCQMLLSNLTTIVNCFLTEAQELTERGLVDLMNKRIVSTLLSQYAQVVLWFCRSGLLPEGSDDADLLQLSKPIYNYPVIQNYYTNRRHKLERLSKGRWCSDCLLIDGMVSETGGHIEQLWKKDEGGTGKYPPSSLHALLDVYLLENVDETTKHAIAIYLLLDVLSSVPNKNESSIESFPPAFAIPVGLVNLIQGFWLLDHNDHENGLDRILHPATSRSLSSWQHVRIIQALMCQGEYRKALRYVQAMKPTMSSSSEVKLHLTVLLFNRSMVEAWHLLRLNANRVNVEDLSKHVYELCQENGLMEELLKLPFTGTEQECLEKFLKNSGNLQNQEFLLIHHLQRANYVPALQLHQSLKTSLIDHDPQMRERTATRNSILEQYGKVLPNVQRKLATERSKPYHHLAILREVKRPKPLSTVVKRSTSGSVVTRATFINSVLSKVNEVWLKNMQGVTPSPLNSPRCSELHLKSTEVSDAFVGTPINSSSRKLSRLLESMRQLKTPATKKAEPIRYTQTKADSSWMTTSPLQLHTVNGGYRGGISKASELKLLQTPPVVKKARAFMSTEATFANFTPQSILRSNLRSTPLASPCASPSRSSTPPFHSKGTKISFVTEKPIIRWTNGDELQLPPSSSKQIPRTPSIESWPSTTDNQVTSELTPDDEVLFGRVKMVDLSRTDKDANKDDVDSSGKTEDWSMEEYVDAAESLDRGDISKEMGKTVSADELVLHEERILSCDAISVNVTDGHMTGEISQPNNKEVTENELCHVDNGPTFQCEEVLDVDKNERMCPSVTDTAPFICSNNEEAVLPMHNLESSNESEKMDPERQEDQLLSQVAEENERVIQSEDLRYPSTTDAVPLIIVDDEDIIEKETRNEKMELALSGYEESDIKVMDDIAECTQDESIAVSLPENTQLLQDVSEGLELDAQGEESCSVVSIELKLHEPVLFQTVMHVDDLPDQSNDKAKVLSEAERDGVLVREYHNIEDNFTFALENGDEDKDTEQLMPTEINQKPAFVNKGETILLDSLKTKMSESIKKTPENNVFDNEEQLCSKNNSFVLQQLEDEYKFADSVFCVPDPIRVDITNSMEVVEEGQSIDNSLEVLKGGQSMDNSTEVLKGGQSMDNSTEVLKGGQSMDNSPEALKGGQSTDNSMEVLKGGQSTDNSPEVLKGGQSTDNSMEVLKEGQSMDNSPVLKGGQSTDNSTVLKGGQSTDNSMEVLKGGQSTDNATEVLKGDQPIDNSMEALKEGQSTDNSMEVLKEGQSTDNSTEALKGGQSTDNATEILKGGQSTDNATEVLKGGQSTDNATEVLKGGQSTDNSTEVLKGGQSTDNSTEVLKEGQSTDISTEVLKGGQSTDNSVELHKGGRSADDSVVALERGQSTDDLAAVLEGEKSEMLKLPVQVDTGIIKQGSGLYKREAKKETKTDTVEDVNRNVMQAKQMESVAMSTRSFKGNRNKVGEISSMDHEELVFVEIQKVKPTTEMPAKPRRSTRRIVTGINEVVKNSLEEQKGMQLYQKSDSIHISTRSTRKTITHRPHDTETNLLDTNMPVLRSKRKSAAVRADAEHVLDNSLKTPRQQPEVTSISQRSSRQKRRKLSEVDALLNNPISVLEINEHIPVVPTPSRLTRSRAKDAHLVALENIAELTSNVAITLPVKAEMTRRGQPVTSKETPKSKVKDNIVDDRQEEQLTVTFTHKPARRKPGKDSESHAIILAQEDSYSFSPPLTRSSRKSKVEKTTLQDPTVQQPEFTFSTPLTRSRRPNKTPLQDLDILKDAVPKIKVVRKGEEGKSKQEEKIHTRHRTTRLRVKKSPRVTKKGSWTAPPVEIEFLSPLASPLSSLSNQGKGTDDAGCVEHKMTLRHKRSKMNPVFRKPVTRRKVNRHK
ncbi:protein ELYS isoform X2 [Narcine bancroftii]|uniref:protein ELYS isoform X2 n=1 Tax=Narcine bancroftii TaxID=1343680 RepID=UPI0038315ECA